ncbi:MAG TPA: CHRD domain-containing protein [Xanthomonadales bacterium]|nr:CHRD domain-containing protein [Xanthomonadales bacterium]
MKRFLTSLFCLLVATPLFAANALNFRVVLSGANEVPPVDTPTSGVAILHVNQKISEIDFKLDIKNAVDALGVAGAHFHCAPAGANGGVAAFLAGAFSPGYDGNVQLRATLNDASVIAGPCGSNIAELVESMLDGNVYINVHSTSNPSGVIRGQVQ